ADRRPGGPAAPAPSGGPAAPAPSGGPAAPPPPHPAARPTGGPVARGVVETARRAVSTSSPRRAIPPGGPSRPRPIPPHPVVRRAPAVSCRPACRWRIGAAGRREGVVR
ncbi:MAG: hypothetical protein SNJ69_07230, partial [Chloroflexaceae bacterium]